MQSNQDFEMRQGRQRPPIQSVRVPVRSDKLWRFILIKKIDKQKKTKWNTIKVRLTTSSMAPASTNVVSAEEHSKSFKVITEALGKNTKYVAYLNLKQILHYLDIRIFHTAEQHQACCVK